MRRSLALTVAAAGTSLGVVAGTVLAAAGTNPGPDQQSMLVGRGVLPARSFRAGSPPSGAFLTADNLKTAAGNGVLPPASGPLFASQPIQGISALVPDGGGAWWALADNGYGTRETSADWQLALYRLGSAGGAPNVLNTVVLSDPGRMVPWTIVCDPGRGSPLPKLSFNVLPASPPAACGPNRAARILTGFDFDPESIEIGADGTFWIGEEFGPFLLHADRQGRLLEAPIEYPAVRSPQNPNLDLSDQKHPPNVAASRGFEGLAISPDRTRLYAMFEGAVGDDDPQDVRIVTFDIAGRRFTGEVHEIRLEMPGAKANPAALLLTDGTTRAYPNAAAPTGTGGESVAELTALDDHRFLLLERDANGDGVDAPRFKKVFVVDFNRDGDAAGYVQKSPLVDLMAVPDPKGLGGDGNFFRFPFNTIESVHVVDDHTIVVANDNNFPFSNGRARSRTADRSTNLAPDDTELILVQVSTSLHPDPRLLPR
jgi:hypothetical protein